MIPPAPDQLARRRAISAAAPGPDAASLRRAYLDLLKLCLCDLAGATTRTVTWTGDRRVFSRELIGADQLEWRIDGKDWPQNGLSMIGLRRLDDLQACVESVVADQVAGDLIEAGSWRGGAAILMRATLDALGADDRTVWVADSFQGFPAPDPTADGADPDTELHMSAIDFLASTVDDVTGYFKRFGYRRGVQLVPGFFEETMDGLRGRDWSVLRLDADTYRATRLALEALYPGLAVGGYLVVDDYYHPYLPTSCRQAVDDFRAAHAISEPIEQIDWNGARWRRETESHGALTAVGNASTERGARRPVAVARGTGSTIPTDRELQLADEVAALAARLSDAQARLTALESSPVVPALAWARRRVRTFLKR